MSNDNSSKYINKKYTYNDRINTIQSKDIIDKYINGEYLNVATHRIERIATGTNKYNKEFLITLAEVVVKYTSLVRIENVVVKIIDKNENSTRYDTGLLFNLIKIQIGTIKYLEVVRTALKTYEIRKQKIYDALDCTFNSILYRFERNKKLVDSIMDDFGMGPIKEIIQEQKGKSLLDDMTDFIMARNINFREINKNVRIEMLDKIDYEYIDSLSDLATKNGLDIFSGISEQMIRHHEAVRLSNEKEKQAKNIQLKNETDKFIRNDNDKVNRLINESSNNENACTGSVYTLRSRLNELGGTGYYIAICKQRLVKYISQSEFEKIYNANSIEEIGKFEDIATSTLSRAILVKDKEVAEKIANRVKEVYEKYRAELESEVERPRLLGATITVQELQLAYTNEALTKEIKTRKSLDRPDEKRLLKMAKMKAEEILSKNEDAFVVKAMNTCLQYDIEKAAMGEISIDSVGYGRKPEVTMLAYYRWTYNGKVEIMFLSDCSEKLATVEINYNDNGQNKVFRGKISDGHILYEVADSGYNIKSYLSRIAMVDTDKAKELKLIGKPKIINEQRSTYDSYKPFIFKYSFKNMNRIERISIRSNKLAKKVFDEFMNKLRYEVADELSRKVTFKRIHSRAISIASESSERAAYMVIAIENFENLLFGRSYFLGNARVGKTMEINLNKLKLYKLISDRLKISDEYIKMLLDVSKEMQLEIHDKQSMLYFIFKMN